MLDFGYGGICQIRLLASLGGDVVGVDIEPFLGALYASEEDQGQTTKLSAPERLVERLLVF